MSFVHTFSDLPPPPLKFRPKNNRFGLVGWIIQEPGHHGTVYVIFSCSWDFDHPLTIKIISLKSLVDLTLKIFWLTELAENGCKPKCFKIQRHLVAKIFYTKDKSQRESQTKRTLLNSFPIFKSAKQVDYK